VFPRKREKNKEFTSEELFGGFRNFHWNLNVLLEFYKKCV
jgi:hypothetical protein